MNNQVPEEWFEPFPFEHKAYNDYIFNNAHTLIAGTTGAGKSVLIRSLLCYLFSINTDFVECVLIDPKKIDYYELRTDPHILRYASKPDEITQILQQLIQVMDNRLQNIRNGFKGTFSHIFIIIDEYPDIVQTNPSAVKLIERLTRLSRAVNIHCIIATQRPTKDIINGVIAANMSVKIALRCATAQESRNIIGVSGAECLPLFGECIIRHPNATAPERWAIDYTPPEKFQTLKKYWLSFN